MKVGYKELVCLEDPLLGEDEYMSFLGKKKQNPRVFGPISAEALWHKIIKSLSFIRF